MLLTTHYMDEAERCHRLAFIFRGSLLDVGTPDEIVARRQLRRRGARRRASRRCRRRRCALHPRSTRCAHFGHLLRVATRGVDDPEAVGASAGRRPSGHASARCEVRGRASRTPSCRWCAPTTRASRGDSHDGTRRLSIAWKELLQLRRDRLTLAMMVVLPLLQLLLFGYAINTDVRHMPTLVFDADRIAADRAISRAA